MQKDKFYNQFRIHESDLNKLNGEIKIFHSELYDGNYATKGEQITILAKIPREIYAKDIKAIFFANNLEISDVDVSEIIVISSLFQLKKLL